MINLVEALEDVKRRLATPKWNISHKPHEWFFAGDVAPHSNTFKYRCKKLYEAGVLERQGDGTNRWGYRYRVPLPRNKKDKK